MCDISIQSYTLQGVPDIISDFESRAGMSSDEFLHVFRRGGMDTMAGNVWAALIRERDRMRESRTEGDVQIASGVQQLV